MQMTGSKCKKSTKYITYIRVSIIALFCTLCKVFCIEIQYENTYCT